MVNIPPKNGDEWGMVIIAIPTLGFFLPLYILSLEVSVTFLVPQEWMCSSEESERLND